MNRTSHLMYHWKLPIILWNRHNNPHLMYEESNRSQRNEAACPQFAWLPTTNLRQKFIKNFLHFTICNGILNNNKILEKPHYKNIWVIVAYLTFISPLKNLLLFSKLALFNMVATINTVLFKVTYELIKIIRK